MPAELTESPLQLTKDDLAASAVRTAPTRLCGPQSPHL